MNDKKLITNRLLGLCGVALLLCWALKLWGKVVFDFVVTNETMISVCNFIENSVVQYVIYYALYIISGVLNIGIISGKKDFTKKKLIIFIVTLSIIFSFNFFAPIIKTILDFIVFPLFAIIFFKTKWWKSILWLTIIVATQFILLQIRNMDYTLYQSNFMVGLLMQIDYYIMLVILYIRRTI